MECHEHTLHWPILHKLCVQFLWAFKLSKELNHHPEGALAFKPRHYWLPSTLPYRPFFSLEHIRQIFFSSARIRQISVFNVGTYHGIWVVKLSRSETYVGRTIRSLCHINSLSRVNLTARRPYPVFTHSVTQWNWEKSHRNIFHSALTPVIP